MPVSLWCTCTEPQGEVRLLARMQRCGRFLRQTGPDIANRPRTNEVFVFGSVVTASQYGRGLFAEKVLKNEDSRLVAIQKKPEEAEPNATSPFSNGCLVVVPSLCQNHSSNLRSCHSISAGVKCCLERVSMVGQGFLVPSTPSYPVCVRCAKPWEGSWRDYEVST